MIALPNPWLTLGATVAVAALSAYSYHAGQQAGKQDVQSAWDSETIKISEASLRVSAQTRINERALQDAADQEKKENANKIENLRSRLTASLDELRKRPARPSGANDVPSAAPVGPIASGTGAGLYGEDARFLIGEAARATTILLQRDSCYRLYEAARSSLIKLGSSKE